MTQRFLGGVSPLFFLSLWREISGCGKVCLALSLRVSVYKGKRRKREWTTLPREKWEKLSVSTLSLSSRVESVAPFSVCPSLNLSWTIPLSIYTHTHTAISPATSSSAVSERERKKREIVQRRIGVIYTKSIIHHPLGKCWFRASMRTTSHPIQADATR